MKVAFFDEKICKKTFNLFLIILGVSSTLVSFFETTWQTNVIVLLSVVFISLIVHLVFWILSNRLETINLKINNSILTIRLGDLFKEQDHKVIPFNEYFDTSFSNAGISESTLHGRYLKSFVSVKDLDEAIDRIPKEKIVEENCNRISGKKTKFKLGTILVNDGFYLLAFSHFDENNRAWLTQNEYVACLLNMWSEIDKIYNGQTVCLPLLGSGITRMKDNTDISDEELLKILLWTFRISKVKFTYPSKVKILVFPAKKDKIDLFKIREEN